MKYIKLLVFAAIFLLCSIEMASCNDNDEPSKQNYDGTPLIILDTDIGSSTDDLFALEMLYYYHNEERCKLLGVVVDRMGEHCAAITDVMNTYFGHPDVPIGLVRNGIASPQVWIDYSALPSYTGSDGTPMFRRSVNDYSTLPDGWQLYRRLLAAQPDHSVSICSIGFVTSLSQLLASSADEYSPLNGVELVRKKVKCLYIMGGVMIFSPMEVGQGIEYKPEQVVADVSWTDIHPIKQVYMQCNCNTGQMMWDPMAVINAVEGDEEFSLSQRGIVSLTPQAETIFTPDAKGNCRYQLPGSSDWNSSMLEKIRKVNISLVD